MYTYIVYLETLGIELHEMWVRTGVAILTQNFGGSKNRGCCESLNQHLGDVRDISWSYNWDDHSCISRFSRNYASFATQQHCEFPIQGEKALK